MITIYCQDCRHELGTNYDCAPCRVDRRERAKATHSKCVHCDGNCAHKLCLTCPCGFCQEARQ